MKKKLSLLLAIVMLVALALPSIPALAAENDQLQIKWEGTNCAAGKLYGNPIPWATAKGIEFEMKLKSGSDSFNGAQVINIKYDDNVLAPCAAAAGVPVIGTAASGAVSLNAGTGWSVQRCEQTGNTLVLILVYEAVSGDASPISYADWTTIGYVYFAYASGKSDADLNSKSITLTSTLTDLQTSGTNASLSYNSGNGGTYTMNACDNVFQNYTVTTDTLPDSAFAVSYPHTGAEPVATLATLAVTPSADQSIAVPTAADYAADSNTVGKLTLSATAKDTDTESMTFPSDAVWVIYSDTACTTAVTTAPAGFTGATGSATASFALAPTTGAAGVYYVRAESADGSVVSNTVKVTVTKAASAVTTVTVDGPASATIPESGAAANTSNKYTATVKDQFGVAMDNESVNWSLVDANGASISAGSGDDAGKGILSVPSSATNNSTTKVTATSASDSNKSGFKAVTLSTKSLSISGTAAGHAALDFATANGKTYTQAGLSASDMADGLTVTLSTTSADVTSAVTWSFDAPSATLGWGPNTITLKATYSDNGEEVSKTTTVPVKVLKYIDTTYVSIADKTYDKSDVLDKTKVSFTSNLKTGDSSDDAGTVTDAAGTYADKNAGTSKTVTLSKLEFTLPTGADNYYFTTAKLDTNKTVTAKVDKKELTTVTVKTTSESSSWTLDDLIESSNMVAGDTFADVIGTLSPVTDHPGVFKDAKNIVTVTFYELNDTPAYVEAAAAPAAGNDYVVGVTIAANTADLTNYKTVAKSTPASAPTYSADSDGNETTVLTAYTKLSVTSAPVYTGGGSSNKDKDKDKTDKEHFVHGYEDGKFRPGNLIKRSEIAQMIANLHKVFDKAIKYPSSGRDVPADQWYTAPVNFCGQQGIMTGDESGMRPEDTIKRSELAVVLVRFLGLKLDTNTGFADVKADDWYAGYVGALKNAGITKGYEDNTFRANQDITRSEAVAMINRALGLTEADVDAFDIIPADLDDIADWAKQEILISMNADITPYKK